MIQPLNIVLSAKFFLVHWVIIIATGITCIKSITIIGIQFKAVLKAINQVGVGNEMATVSNQVGSAFFNNGVAFFKIEAT
ncbi:MAG: hypothetical protein JWQ57_1991, partial [Mucilaginibacter sp.]|nr:hypothetical protein [Mucilaginibacter sp.]